MRQTQWAFIAVSATGIFLQVNPVQAQAVIQPKAAPVASASSTVVSGTIGHPFLSGPDSADRTWLLEVATESRSVEEDRTPAPNNAADGKTRPAGTQPPKPHYRETSDTKRGYAQVRTTRVFPQPNLRNTLSLREYFDLGNDSETRRIYAALRSPIGRPLTFTETPLRDVIATLDEALDIPIDVDRKAFDDAGLDVDTTVITIDISGGTIRSALRRILDDIDLTYLVDKEVLLITTKDRASDNLPVRSYPIPRFSTSDAESLTELLRTFVGPGEWLEEGGRAAIELMPGTNRMMISQTEERHEEIMDFLAHCDDLSLPIEKDSPVPTAMPTRVYRVTDESLHEELAKKLVHICNDALGASGDPDAKVTSLGNRLVVQSRKRAFHIYAAEFIHAINGEDVTVTQAIDGASSVDRRPVNTGMEGSGIGMGGGVFSVPPEAVR